MISCRLLLQPQAHEAASCLEGTSSVERLDDKVDAYSAEWLLMEFDHIVVIEQLSQGWGAVRIFNKTAAIERGLVENSNLSLHDLVMAFQDDIHDHNMRWQWSLEKKLRTEYKLFPNDSTSKFLGLPPAVANYSKTDGLLTPSRIQVKERFEEVRQWESFFIEREKAIGKYAVDSARRADPNASRANRLKSMLNSGDAKEAIEELRIYSDQDELWSLKLLSEYLLTVPNGTYNMRSEGEALHAYHKQLLSVSGGESPTSTPASELQYLSKFKTKSSVTPSSEVITISSHDLAVVVNKLDGGLISSGQFTAARRLAFGEESSEFKGRKSALFDKSSILGWVGWVTRETDHNPAWIPTNQKDKKFVSLLGKMGPKN